VGTLKKGFLIGFFLIFILACQKTTPTTTTTPIVSENNVYVMDLTLDDTNDRLKVEGELSYKNEQYDLDDLYLLLYPNAMNLGGSAYNIQMEYLKINGVDAVYTIEGSDDTAYHVNLSESLPKGQRISITYCYDFAYWPDNRIANYGDYYLTMFFYPFVAMMETDGWHVEPFSFRGETYYNEIGDYFVTIDVPSSYLIASGGDMTAVTSNAGRKIYHYELRDARDFSFCASSSYHLYERNLQGTDFSIYSTRSLTNAEIEASFEYLENTMVTMEGAVGDYYYDHFTLEYGYFYGMESSGIVYCSEEIEEGTVVHELVHQWFYSMIGNDQANESFVDEALTTYAVSFYYYDLYGVNGYNGYLDVRSSLNPAYVTYYNANLGVNMLRHVDDYGNQYAYLIYYHGPAMFRYFVEEFLDGDVERMKTILAAYYQEYVKENASLDQLLDLLEAESGDSTVKEWFLLQLNEFQDFANRP